MSSSIDDERLRSDQTDQLVLPVLLVLLVPLGLWVTYSNARECDGTLFIFLQMLYSMVIHQFSMEIQTQKAVGSGNE